MWIVGFVVMVVLFVVFVCLEQDRVKFVRRRPKDNQYGAVDRWLGTAKPRTRYSLYCPICGCELEWRKPNSISTRHQTHCPYCPSCELLITKPIKRIQNRKGVIKDEPEVERRSSPARRPVDPICHALYRWLFQ